MGTICMQCLSISNDLSSLMSTSAFRYRMSMALAMYGGVVVENSNAGEFSPINSVSWASFQHSDST